MDTGRDPDTHPPWASSYKSYKQQFQTMEGLAMWKMNKANGSLQPKGPSQLFSPGVFFLTVIFTELISVSLLAQYPAIALTA